MRREVSAYKHFGRCLVLDNGVVECVASLEFGPRILSFRLLPHGNVFFEQPANADYLCSADGWRVYGGTRFWLAPESEHDVYFPDNGPVCCEPLPDGAVLKQAVDPRLQVEKTVTLRFSCGAPALRVEYAVYNRAEHALTGAPWIVSMMGPGAVLTIPFACHTFAARPERCVSLWNGTSLTDPRLVLHDDWLRITQTPVDTYFKLGVLCGTGMARCQVGEQLFTKRFSGGGDGLFPDGNVNLEVYCCKWMMEFETLSQLQTIPPGKAATHSETWRVDRMQDKEAENG